MALLIDIRDPDWMTEQQLAEQLAPSLPGVRIHTGSPTETMEDVTMLAVSRLYPGVVEQLPNLQLVQKLGAGVETIVADPTLPAQVRVARLKPDAPAREISEFCLAYVLRDQQNLLAHADNAARQDWRPLAPGKTLETIIAVLGLGHIGSRVATVFASLGFRVVGWSRSPKSIAAVDCRSGPQGLAGVLAVSDYVASVLPSTRETRNLFNADTFRLMKQGSMLINVGRGDLVEEEALLAALDQRRPAKAVLDVFRREPLPAGHPFWEHPRITVTPHVSGWHIDDGLPDVAANYLRLQRGESLLNEVDRGRGY